MEFQVESKLDSPNLFLLQKHVCAKKLKQAAHSVSNLFKNYFCQKIFIQPCNYQLSKSIVHEIKFDDIAVMYI